MPLTCQDFLARYSEYVDGRLDPQAAGLLEDHMAGCASCARYDRVVRKGTDLLRSFPEVEPSWDFFPRLQHRIYNLEDELRGRHRGGAGAAASLAAVAAMIAALAWSPLLRYGLERRVDEVQVTDAGALASDAGRGEAADAPIGSAARSWASSPVGSPAGAGLAPSTFPRLAPYPRYGSQGGVLPNAFLQPIELAAEAAFPASATWRRGAWQPVDEPGERPFDRIPDGWWYQGRAAAGHFSNAVQTMDFRYPETYSPLVVSTPPYRRASRVMRTDGAQPARD